MNELQNKLERLKLMLIEDGYNDSNIVYRTLKETQELAINYMQDCTELPIYITYDDSDSEVFAAFTDKERCELKSQRSEMFCKCTTDTDIYQSEGSIKCQTCYKKIKMQNYG